MAVKPKLCMIPSGVGTDTLYSVLPSDGTGDFTFDRNLNTATRINKDGLIEMVDADVPRLNYPMIDGVVSGCPSLLLEPTRSNLLQYSEDIATHWGAGSSTITSNQGISPNGTLNADLVSSVSVNGNVSTSHTVLNNSLTTTQSIFVKHISGTSNFMLRGAFVGGVATAKASKFNLETSSVISTDTTASIEYYGNGWYRLSQQISNNSSGNTTLIFQNFTTNDIISTNELLLWGAQSEVGSYPTSYIPTNGGSVTRSAETCNGSGDANTFNDSEGVLMAEINFKQIQNTSRYISVNDGGSTDRILFGVTGNTNNLKGFVYQDGQPPYLLNTDININSTQKIALSYKTNLIKFYVSGFKIGEITTAVMPTGLNRLSFNDGVAADFYGNTKQLQYFDTALTDQELINLTKI